MAERAYWEQTNRFGVVDRIEIHDAQYSGTSPELQFLGDKTGFSFGHDEITSESNDKLLNIQANRIQIGKLDFRPRIENAAGFTLLTDIRDSDNKRFHIVRKRDGVFQWAGWITTKIFSYPEKDNNFIAHIRATDFEILKGVDYPLTDNRQTFITTLSNLFSELPTSVPIKTATSWVEENVTARVGSEVYDFLAEIRHETRALRDFANTGDETDQPITKWQALEHVAEPALLIRQHRGYIYIDQLTELADDPTTTHETIYNADGTVQTATRAIDRTQTGYTTTDNGTPSIKITSQNDTYPAIKSVRNTFDHRTGVNNISFPSLFSLDSNNTSDVFSQFFISDGDQKLFISGRVEAFFSQGYDDAVAPIQIRVVTSGGTTYYYDIDASGNGWGATSVTNNISLTNTGRSSPQGTLHQAFVNIETDKTPTGADGTLEIEFFRGESLSSGFADTTQWRNMTFNISNAIAKEDSKSIKYVLTQSGGYAETFKLPNTWYGDGPIGYSVSALRHGAGDGDTTGDTWRRRGQTIAYRNYHENLLKEVIDLARTNARKLEADIWGDYNPSAVLSYNGSLFYFAGGHYDGTTGRWRATLMELSLETGTDTFEDILKFTNEADTGTSTTAGGTTSGGGLSQDTADARYFEESKNLSEGDPATMRSNLGVVIGSDVQAWDADLDTYASNPLTASELGQLQNIGTTTISATQWGYVGALDQGLATTDPVTYAKATLSNLTSGRVLYAGTNGLVQDNSALTFDGTTLASPMAKLNIPTDAGFGATIQRNSATGRAQNRLLDEGGNLLWRYGATAGGDASFNFFDGTDDVLKLANGDGRFASNLYVEGGLYAEEFVVEQTRLFAEQIFGPMGAKIESVSGSAGSETITLSNEFGAGNPFSAGALVRVQARTGQSSGTIIKRLLRKVDSISGMDVTLTTTGVNNPNGTSYSTTDDVGSIEAGDHAVGWGHATDATLDHYIHVDVANVAIPAIRIFDEVTNFDAGFEALRVGGMDGFDASITGDIGIAGATKADGAVFWITEDEARMGKFTIKDDYFTGNQVYIGNNLGRFDTDSRILIGYYGDGSNQLFKASGVNGSQVQMAARTSSGLDFFHIENNGGQRIVEVTDTQAKFFGAYTDATDLWGYKSGYSGSTSDKTAASVRLDFQNGRILYDAMGGSLSSKFIESTFGQNNEVDSIIDSEWWVDMNHTSDGTISNSKTLTIIRGRYRHKFGIDEMTLQSYAKAVLVSSTGTWNRNYDLMLKIYETQGGSVIASDSEPVAEGGAYTLQNLALTGLNSALTRGSYYIVEVDLNVSVTPDPNNVSGDSINVQLYMREDYNIDVGT